LEFGHCEGEIRKSAPRLGNLRRMCEEKKVSSFRFWMTAFPVPSQSGDHFTAGKYYYYVDLKWGCGG
jgi:hypothetical protein